MSIAKRTLVNRSTGTYVCDVEGHVLRPGGRRLVLLSDPVAQARVASGHFFWYGEIVDPDPEPEPDPPAEEPAPEEPTEPAEPESTPASNTEE